MAKLMKRTTTKTEEVFEVDPDEAQAHLGAAAGEVANDDADEGDDDDGCDTDDDDESDDAADENDGKKPKKAPKAKTPAKRATFWGKDK